MSDWQKAVIAVPPMTVLKTTLGWSHDSLDSLLLPTSGSLQRLFEEAICVEGVGAGEAVVEVHVGSSFRG